MVKNHLKRLSSPKKWRIKRKGIKFIIRPSPGPHNLETGLPLAVVLRDMLNYAGTLKEVKNILNNKTLLVNGIRRKEPSFSVGLFDIIEIKESKEYLRIVFDKKGKISVMKTEKTDAQIRPSKIKNKTKVKGKTQLNFFNGDNLIIEKDDYKTGDTLILTVPKNEIKKKLEFKKSALIYLTGGKHVGTTGTIEEIKGNKIIYKVGSDLHETAKKYAFVIGENKPLVKIE